MLCIKINFRKSRKRLWAINLSAVNSVSRFHKLTLLCLFVRLFVVVQSISVIFDPSESFFQLFYFSLVNVSMTKRKYVFNWLYYILWNFSTCICPVGMEKVSTELITEAFFFNNSEKHEAAKQNAKRRFMHKVLFYYGVILSSSFSGNSQQPSQQKSCSLETSHFPQDMGSTKDG